MCWVRHVLGAGHTTPPHKGHVKPKRRLRPSRLGLRVRIDLVALLLLLPLHLPLRLLLEDQVTTLQTGGSKVRHSTACCRCVTLDILRALSSLWLPLRNFDGLIATRISSVAAMEQGRLGEIRAILGYN